MQLSDDFEQTMNGNLVGTLAPALVNVVSVLFLHTGIAFGMGLYYLSSVGQLGYTLYPLAKHRDKLQQDKTIEKQS